ncbi:MAG: hypothetical protein MZU95_13660 [Desulfomicrobium escambiense]|nr:hypothetical protein [Desulfomicrobium escambiense]
MNFETDICEHLAAHGWLYADGDAAHYDRARALFPADVLAWVQDTQPNAWETLEQEPRSPRRQPCCWTDCATPSTSAAPSTCCVTASNCSACAQPLTLAQFKPALAMNPELLARYAANRLRVVRQVRYSLHNENALDLVPVPQRHSRRHGGTEDRLHPVGRGCRRPVPLRPSSTPQRTGRAEPLLSFPNGALVHFAVSNTRSRA